MELVFIWVAFGVVTAIAASQRGRSAVGWFLLGILFSFFALIVVLILPRVETKQAAPVAPSAQPFPRAQPLPVPPRVDGREPVRLQSPGMFDIEVAGTGQHQGALLELVGSLPNGQSQWRGRALLRHDVKAPAHLNSVVVLIEGSVVGLLPRVVSARYSADMIEQGASRQDALVAAKTFTTPSGEYGVKLDIGSKVRLES